MRKKQELSFALQFDDGVVRQGEEYTRQVGETVRAVLGNLSPEVENALTRRVVQVEAMPMDITRIYAFNALEQEPLRDAYEQVFRRLRTVEVQ